MPINEPRIYPARKPWEGLKEIYRDEQVVKFKTKTGTLIVPLKEFSHVRRP